MKGRSSVGMSAGLYSMSASCTTRDVAGRVLQRRAHRGALAAVPLVPIQLRRAESCAATCCSTCPRPVGAAVVDDDDFEARDDAALERQHAGQAGGHEVPLVVDRGQYAEADTACQIRLVRSRVDLWTRSVGHRVGLSTRITSRLGPKPCEIAAVLSSVRAIGAWLMRMAGSIPNPTWCPETDELRHS